MTPETSPNPSMQDKLVLITGATSGIGKEIAMQLAARGARLVLACRNMTKGEQVRQEIATLTGSSDCELMHVDMSDPTSIREFARGFRKKIAHLDVLINNAGINSPQKQCTKDGIELTFATNVLGYYLLTTELLDLLKASAPARIVNTASSFASDLDLDDLQFKRRRYSGRKAYAQSKACDRMLSWAFARRLAYTGVSCNAFAPGLVLETGIYRDETPATMLLMRIISKFFGHTVAEGADTAVWLASSPEVEGASGQFYDQRQVVPCKFRNDAAEERLWAICETLTVNNNN